ncbi:ribosomal RNA small subunit methyltransferase E isoform X1 [Tanacetum coccineum]
MQVLHSIPHFTIRSCRKTFNLRAFSSDSSNQSRGGLPRFFSDNFPSSKGCVVRVQGDEFWHMTKVLRLNAHDRIELFNGKGGLVEGCIERIDRTGADVVALEDPKLVSNNTTQWHVFAAFGTLKGGRSDWLIEKCTELGASSVTPLLTARSPSISENRVDRLQRVILAAAKQCQRLHEMTLNPPLKVGGLIPIVSQSKLSFIAAAEATPVLNALSLSQKENVGSIIIGPEGDFTETEVKSILEAGATSVGLGPHRLRVETATVALLSTAMLWSDSQQLSKVISPDGETVNAVSLPPPARSEFRTLDSPTMTNQFENLIESIKSKVKALKRKKTKKVYVKMDKTNSVRVEIRSRHARKLIDKTLQAADQPGKRPIA